MGANAVSWAPATLPGSLTAPSQPSNPAQNGGAAAPQQVKRFATGGCDSMVRIWAYDNAEQKWKLETTLEGHTDWVRDVAWQDNIGLNKSYLASASQVRRERARAKRRGCTQHTADSHARFAHRTKRSSSTSTTHTPTPGPRPRSTHRTLAPAKAANSTTPSGACLGLSPVPYWLSPAATARSRCGKRASRASSRWVRCGLLTLTCSAMR